MQWWTQWKSWEVSFITSSRYLLQNGKKIQIAYPKHRSKQKGIDSCCTLYATGIFFLVWSTCSIQKLYNCFHYSRNTMKILEIEVKFKAFLCNGHDYTIFLCYIMLRALQLHCKRMTVDQSFNIWFSYLRNINHCLRNH